MNLGGWIMMTVSIGLVLALFGYCIYKVLTTRDPHMEDELRGPLDIDTKDHEDD